MALTLQGLGTVWIAKGDPNRAFAEFQRLKEQGGAAFEKVALWNMAKCYERLGKNKEALEIYQGLQGSVADALQKELAKAKVTELSSTAKP
jgi:lipopolysaccharide biosynthesis regulator YciM